MWDTRPQTLLPVAVACTVLATLGVMTAVSVAHNGPDRPALFNNARVPITVTIDGVTQDPVLPGTTLWATRGTVWVVPADLSCNWHPGQAGTPREISAATLPITGYTTVELCLPRATS